MEQLQKFVKSHTHDEIQPELLVQMGIAPDFILSLAQSQKVDVIVIGTHGRRGYDHLMLGSVTERVMRNASCPLLAVCCPSRDSEDAGAESGHVHHLSRILFCTDFSEHSEQALTYALSVRAEYDAELTLVHVLEDAPSPAKTEKAIAAATERLVKMIQSDSSNTLKIRTAVRIGKAYRQIVDLAVETQSDMVVMGVRGRGALDLAVFGSTTYRVMQLGPCPVLAVQVGNPCTSVISITYGSRTNFERRARS